ncbi:ATP-grasp domain-containing protein [Candidatus Dojkabacteria bacterium]|uniref:ATP-grasp domain-containing protein n=1 Tax=Candidatus Dojkabacteria bacterium TaxID=2099670 RepID=A0A955L5I4_9BACT|nr:ATP-grasp domain-containing protein [Candidatus Dojkabacteria bacterium]
MNTITNLIGTINQKLDNSAYFYLSNDPERALGLENLLNNYHIVHIDDTQYLEHFDTNGVNYFCLDKELAETNSVYRSSLKLLKHPAFAEYFNKNMLNHNWIETFKISPAFEKYVENIEAKQINTPASLNRTFENKISQYINLQDIGVSWPKTIITKLADFDYEQLVAELGDRFVIQFDRGHTGEGTIFVNDQEKFSQIKSEFPNRVVRISKFTEGLAYTINCLVGVDQVYCGGLSYQVTGIPELTTLKGATIGNDWHYREFVDEHRLKQIIDDVVKIGNKMREQKYHGLFGIDLIVSEDSHTIIEINARQAASVAMHTKIQLIEGQIPLKVILLSEILGIKHNIDSSEYNYEASLPLEWSQIFNRAKSNYHVNSQVDMGIYRLQSDNSAINRLNDEVVPGTIFLDEEKDKPLILQEKAYSITQLAEGAMLVLAPVKGKEIKRGSEIARLQMNQSASNDGTLKQWVKEALVAIENYQL